MVSGNIVAVFAVCSILAYAGAAIVAGMPEAASFATREIFVDFVVFL